MSSPISRKFPRAWMVFRKVFNLKNLILLLKPLAVLIAGQMMAQFIFERQFGVNEAAEFMKSHPEITGYSTLILTILGFFIWAIVGSATWAVGLYYIFAIIIMFVNTEKMRSRNTPFLIEDLAMSSEAGSLLDMVNWENLWRAVFEVAIVLLAVALIRKFSKKLPRYKFNWKQKIVFRAIILLASGHLLLKHTQFLRTEVARLGKTTVDVDWLKSMIDFTNSAFNFHSNGFVVGTISTLQANTINKPANYNKETINKIIKKYSLQAEQQNPLKKSLKDEKINIIYIMSESFIDPERIRDVYHFEGDPMPFTRSLINSHTSGETTTAEYGGGTANVEFEALTGLSKKFINAIPYSSILNKEKSSPSLAKILNAQNYQTTAIHPYKGTMYRRNVVYPNLGIKNFIDESKMKHIAKIDNSQYISDESAFNEVFETLKNSSSADFIHLVTMQNHMPYGGNIYNSLDFEVKNKTDASDPDAKEWTNYLQGVKRSDEALKNFIEKLNNFEEKTIVAFWGDHWPGIASKIDSETTKHTPLFIYSNFKAEQKPLGQMSLNYLQNEVLNMAGAKKSPFHYLLEELKKSNPKLTTKEVAENNPALQEYELIQYDILAGSKWSAGEFFEIE